MDVSALEEVLDTVVALGTWPDATARIRLWRLPEGVHERSSSDPSRPQGMLIAGEHAIYENTLFSFEGNPYAHRFTGRLDCAHLDHLIREYDERREQGFDPSAANPQPIVSRGRDGLVKDHPFYDALREAAEEAFAPVVAAEEQKERQESGCVENDATRRALNRAARTAARYLQRSLQEIDEDEPTAAGDDAQFSIRPPRANLREGEKRRSRW